MQAEQKKLTGYPSIDKPWLKYYSEEEINAPDKQEIEGETKMSEQKITGYPSADKPWLKYYTNDELEDKCPECRMVDYMLMCNKNRMNKVALSYFGKEITHEKLYNRISECAKALTAAGVKNGKFVSICMLGCPEVIYLTYAANSIGAICNFIAINGTDETIKKQFEITNTRLVFVSDIVTEKMSNLVEDKEKVSVVEIKLSQSMPTTMKVLASLKSRKKFDNVTEWNEFLKKGRNQKMIQSGTMNSNALVEYTSGTTGKSKGVLVTNYSANAFAANHRNMSSLINPISGKLFLNILPPFYAYGIFSGVHAPLCCEMTVVLCPDPLPEKFPKYVNKYKPYMAVGGPLHIEELAKSTKVKDLSFVENLIFGGDKVTEEWENEQGALLKIKGFKHKPQNGYGMTECCGAIAVSNPDGEFMIPLRTNNIKIVNTENGEERGYNEEGEIYVSGPSLMKEYLNDSIATNDAVEIIDNERWLHTGDLGSVNEDGHLKITGRIKRIFWRLGTDGVIYRVYPMAIENILMKLDGVKKCAVLGLEDEKYGYEVVACIIAENKNESLLREYCKNTLPETSNPSRYFFMDNIPTTSAGKIDYKELQVKVLKKET